MTGTILGVVSMERIEKRHAAAVAAARAGMKLSDTAVSVLLSDMAQLINSHNQATARILHAQMALESRAHTDAAKAERK